MAVNESPINNGADSKPRIILECGNKYGFRSVFVPALRELSQFASISVYLIDYPEEYEIRPVLEQLHQSRVIESYSFLTNNQHKLRHHWALRSVSAAVSREKFDVLLFDADFMPMYRYFMRAAQAQGALTLGLLTWVPHQLLGSFESAISDEPSVQSPAPPSYRTLAGLKKLLYMLVRQPKRFIAGLRVRFEIRYKRFVNYRLLPLLLSGRTFRVPSYHQVISVFTSKQVDAVIMYTERQKKALRHFYPWMDVRVALHPLAQNCRCNGQTSKTMLLAALGYWTHWISEDNPLAVIEDQWCEALLKAVELKGFTQIDIRPHPRETEPHADRLAERLRSLGVTAQVVDEVDRSFAEVICDYAGVISSPSGALAEAAVACKQAFVIGLDDVNTQGPLSKNRITEEGVVGKPRGSQLTEEDFTPLLVANGAAATVGGVVRSLIAEKGRP